MHLSPWRFFVEATVNNPASISYIPKIISYIPKKAVNQLFFRTVERKRLGISPRVKLRYNLCELGPTGLLIDRIKEQIFFVSSDPRKSISHESTTVFQSWQTVVHSLCCPFVCMVVILYYQETYIYTHTRIFPGHLVYTP